MNIAKLNITKLQEEISKLEKEEVEALTIEYNDRLLQIERILDKRFLYLMGLVVTYFLIKEASIRTLKFASFEIVDMSIPLTYIPVIFSMILWSFVNDVRKYFNTKLMCDILIMKRLSLSELSHFNIVLDVMFSRFDFRLMKNKEDDQESENNMVWQVIKFLIWCLHILIYFVFLMFCFYFVIQGIIYWWDEYEMNGVSYTLIFIAISFIAVTFIGVVDGVQKNWKEFMKYL